ncbi:MAG: nucleotidyltransferase domain-containing protein [Blastocatellia bacterium]|nr:nucleotidyltransferase domain-containing protein [Blastocatellia bacterium]
MQEKIRQILAEFRSRLEALYGERLEQVILFGSQARGDAVEGSDIDVMIVLKGEVNVGDEISRTSQLCSDLSLAYDVALSRIFTSAERFAHERSPLLSNVHREGVWV